MAQRLPLPYLQFLDSTPAVYSGGSLTFYASGTSMPLDTFSNAGLTIANTNPVVLNSAGRPSVDIFLQNLPYKVVLKDSLGNTIWSADPVASSDFASFSVLKVCSGDPNGQLAGTAGSPGVLPTTAWDFSNRVWYVCVTTGSAATAVWTAINVSSSTQVVPQPQGYLTLTSATPVIAADVSAATSVFYTPFVGNLVPIYNGSALIPTTFSELILALVASHAASTLYDLFVFSDSGTLRLVTGPAWTSSAAGSSSRGTGAGTTELTRLNGFWVNAQQMTARNGSTTYTVAGNYATYVGTILIDSAAGQVTCHRAWGQSRKWGVWNAYNRQRLYLKAGDSTASWSYNTATIRASNNAAANSLTVMSGLAEEFYDLEFVQRINVALSAGDASAANGIGWNSTTVMSGRTGRIGILNSGSADVSHLRGTAPAAFLQVPALGINVVTALENAVVPGTAMDWFGTEAFMVLSARWRG